MKRLLITIALLFAAATTFCQSKNELLYRAISQQDSVTAANLLDKKADPNFKKKMEGFLQVSMLILAVQNDDLNIVKLLVSRGAEIDWRDTFKSTALMYAANQGNKEIINYLVSHGADVNAKDDQGNTVLSAAVEKGDNQVVLLIKNYMNRR